MLFQTAAFCVVTGASKGIGRSIVLSLSDRLYPGSHLVLVARNGDLLRKLEAEVLNKHGKEIGVSVVESDLSNPGHTAFSGWLENAGRGKRFASALLVQNAASIGDVSKRAKDFRDLKELQRYFDINFHSFVLLNNAFLHYCQHTSKPCIEHVTVVDINSGACYKKHECFHIYGAAKAARLSFYANISIEEPKIRVLSYTPGATSTGMQMELGERAWSSQVRKWSQDGTEGGNFPGPDLAAQCLTNILQKNTFESGTLINSDEKSLRFAME